MLGLEEQGVRAGPSAATTAATRWRSADGQQSSALRVGLGLSVNGEIALTHAQLPEDRALICGHIAAGIEQIRTLGANAGQLVNVLPFSEIT